MIWNHSFKTLSLYCSTLNNGLSTFVKISNILLLYSNARNIKKNTFESVLMKWVKLEPIIQSEVSQKEKHQYSILMHIYGI